MGWIAPLGARGFVGLYIPNPIQKILHHITPFGREKSSLHSEKPVLAYARPFVPCLPTGRPKGSHHSIIF
jgi:hypothetical protein